MSDSTTIINGGGKYRVSVMDDPTTESGRKLMRIVTSDGVGTVALAFDNIDALIEFQSEMTTATIKYASGRK
jgi:hypothetical protein